MIRPVNFVLTRQEAAALLDMLPGLIDSKHPNLDAKYSAGLLGKGVLQQLHTDLVDWFEEQR